ncbi:MAG: nif-specific transcriptional activator NifA [Nitrospinae bacterium]|nr:nif-specific transcriptional activator NifA [Nitrospinota bacterium]
MVNDLAARAVEGVFRVSERIARSTRARDTVNEILEILDQVMGYKSGVVTLLDGQSGDLLVEAAHGIPEERYKDVRYRKGEGITGLILQTGAPLAIPRAGADPRMVNRLAVYPPECALVGVPITVNGESGGVLTISVDAGERFRLDEHIRVAVTFANLIGAVVTRLLQAEREKEQIIREKRRLEGQLKGAYRPENMAGVSKMMLDVFHDIAQVAKWNTTVLIRGESGTGKELAAKAIHYQSLRAQGPFVKLNCAALPDTLLESELFGYEKGAFTGAVASKPGRFELAHKGTLFLDEIGDTSSAFQAKLLRVLQEGQFERLGGSRTLTVDVRVVAATNVDLERAVAAREFREDLYYRLNVMTLFMPPLRERREDIPSLVEFFLDKLGTEIGHGIAIAPDALEYLKACDFPGNVRELENCVRRAAVKSGGAAIAAADVPCAGAGCISHLMRNRAADAAPAAAPVGELASIVNERDRVVAALQRAGWVQAKAARLLNMTPRQIGYRIAKLGIEMKTL